MVDLSTNDSIDQWLLDNDLNPLSDNIQPSFPPFESPSITQSSPPPPSSSSDVPLLPITKPTSSTIDPLPPSASTSKKRKHDLHASGTKEHKKKKKSKPGASHMRRNIRSLLTNDKLQDDTLSALKAEQDRLKRLEEINGLHHPFETIYTHLPTSHSNFDQSTFFEQLATSLKVESPTITNNNTSEQDCIVLDDEDEEDTSSSSSSSKEKTSLDSTPTVNETVAADDAGNDSDVQCVDSDSESVNDKLSKKMQRLHVDDRVNVPDENGNILVNINHPNDDPNLYIPKHLCSVLKPHQIGGIRFMYDNIVESLARLQTTPGLGCILAHSMGCGKTVQVITFIDTLLRHTTAKTILVVVPINTIQNWAHEFNRWCPIASANDDYQRPFELYILNETLKKFAQRAKLVQNWSQNGGVLVLGYEMFRLMVTKKVVQSSSSTKNGNKTRVSSPAPSTPVLVDLEEEEKNFETMDDIRNALLNPDLVICDEGHRIKNHQASVALALKSIRTHRRIVLTGYPLQNNLIEYWCMVDFVRPNYLGSKLEFCNMFERPILNGQCIDSTVDDRKCMRARAHVLHSLLEGFIQRRSHDVLRADLPPKDEYVILLKLSSVQRQLYMRFLEAIGVLSSSERTINPLRAFAICCKIWNHADVLYKFVRDRQDGSDLDFDLELEQNGGGNTNRATPSIKSRSTNRMGSVLNSNHRASPVSSPQTSVTTTSSGTYELQTTTFSMEKKEFDYDFANSILNSYVCGQLANGIKFEVTLTLLDRCVAIGDKVLIFSQSLLSLNKLEEFLNQRLIPNTDQKWEKNASYYRLDGGTHSLERERLINSFNTPNSNAKLFLLSTRAGCLGINLIAANRVIVMDVSWNPCHDAQAVCRVYRYGQKKHCYIYRLIADFTMEKRIYDRQIAKQGMSDRVVDELQPQNQFTRNEVENLIHFAAEEEPAAADLLTTIHQLTDDQIMLSVCKQHAQSITKVPFTHESLLCDRKEYQLTSAEKRRAQKEYQDEKRMNIHSYRSRFTPNRISSSFSNYPRFPIEPEIRPYLHSSASVASFDSRYSSFNPNLHSRSLGSMTPLSYHLQEQSNHRKLEQLKQHGINVQQIILQNQLEVQISNTEREFIPTGTRVHIIKTTRGSYIRTPDGKFFAIRQTPSTATLMPVNNPKPIPPPPPPPIPFEPFFFDPNPAPPLPPPPPPSSMMADFNDVDEEIDLLIDETRSNPPLSSTQPVVQPASAFENLSSWHNDYFQQHDFYSDLFSMDPTMSISPSSTIDTNNSSSNFASNALAFI